MFKKALKKQSQQKSPGDLQSKFTSKKFVKPIMKQSKYWKVQTQRSILSKHFEKLEENIKAVRKAKEQIEANRIANRGLKGDEKLLKEPIREQIQSMIDIFSRNSLFYSKSMN